MGKVAKSAEDFTTTRRTMAEVVTERRKNSLQGNLKRSKSVRASLRFIGTKFLINHHSSKAVIQEAACDVNPKPKSSPKVKAKMQKAPSLGSLNQKSSTNQDFKRNFFNQNGVETILKTPIAKGPKLDHHHHHHHHHQKLHQRFFGYSLLSGKKSCATLQEAATTNHNNNKIVTTPPPLVAPKAAQVLHIPIKENCEPLSLPPDYFYAPDQNRVRKNSVNFGSVQFNGGGGAFSDISVGGGVVGVGNGNNNNNGQGLEFRTRPQGHLWDFDSRFVLNAKNGIQRSSLRLSITASRRKNGGHGLRNSSFSSTSKLPSLPSDAEMEVASLPNCANLPPAGGHKPTKKEAKLMQQRLERLAKINIHLHALFAAVEHGHLEKARTILESTDVDVNSLNNDGLSPLDVAVLSNNRPLVKMLVSFGAREGHKFASPEKLGSHLKQLLGEAEMRLQELGGLLEEPCGAPLNTRASFSSIIGNAYPASAMTENGNATGFSVGWGWGLNHASGYHNSYSRKVVLKKDKK